MSHYESECRGTRTSVTGKTRDTVAGGMVAICAICHTETGTVREGNGFVHSAHLPGFPTCFRCHGKANQWFDGGDSENRRAICAECEHADWKAIIGSLAAPQG